MDSNVSYTIFADLDSLVPLFDRDRQFYGDGSDLVGARTSPKEQFKHGESVVFLAEKAGRRVLDTHRDGSLVFVAGPSLLVLSMDHAARKILSFLLSPPLLFSGGFR